MHAILSLPEMVTMEAALSRDAVRELARGVLDAIRLELVAGTLTGNREELTSLVLARLTHEVKRVTLPRLRRVINATGVVLHTNLGRAPLGDRVMADVTEACRGYATLEYNLEVGQRGHRDAIVGPVIAALVGAEDALIVNNCAAAVLLATTALAAQREVIVSRGELVEIGGGFRIPDVIVSCGATLVEVGTTNRTRAADYERALRPATGAILKIHRSNFAIVGFTEEADVRALSMIAKQAGIPLMEDLGSGAMVDTGAYGIAHERTARDAIADGVDLVMVSGDKLLGGPQAGIVLGGKTWIEKLRKHPLMRALRPGRLVTAALEATVRAYTEGRAERDVPAVAMLAEPLESVEKRAQQLCSLLQERTVELTVWVVPVEGRVGGGTLPTTLLRSWAVRVEANDVTMLERGLRFAPHPVVARILNGALFFDVRTIHPNEIESVVATIAWATKATVATGETAAGNDERE
jgi:L-seryl-tRNA(Ser) seleniumtransferase